MKKAIRIALNKTMKLIEMVIDEGSIIKGVDAISIVESPAIGENFIAMKEAADGFDLKFKTADKERRIIVGPALIPNKPIYRNFNGEDCHIFFSAETVLKASQLYLILGNQNNSTIEHEVSINGVHMVESWIIEHARLDKAMHLGFENLPVGTWMVTMKVENEQIWNDFIKTGDVKGFSIEGFFVDKGVREVQAKVTPKEKIKKVFEGYSKK